MILPDWKLKQDPSKKKVLEGEFTDVEIYDLNHAGYNVYIFPNYPRNYDSSRIIDGSCVDTFQYVFVDFDLKSRAYKTKKDFIERIVDQGIWPSKIIDSGNGIHVYWKVLDLDPKSYLRFQRRLTRLFNTDEAVGKLLQLMRLENTLNTKDPITQIPCIVLNEDDTIYTSEELNKLLPPITLEDEEYCSRHYDQTFNINTTSISEILPNKFGKLLSVNPEVKELWADTTGDRSKNDYRLGHVMFANGFTRDEAASVLVNSAKALQRAPTHRQNYANNIIDKIWTFELAPQKQALSNTIREILEKSGDQVKGTPFRCHPRVDNTAHGFRLGQVIGLVAGSGVGKTAFALNLFRWFAQTNPDYHHVFIPLEQPANEIADRWATMSGNDTSLHDKIHVVSNYSEEGEFRHLSFQDIKEYIETLQKEKNIKVGCVVIDHIGALKKKGKDGENQDLMDICHSMKAFAIQTNTLLVMQSQSSREKAGIGDLELNKDAAYGTVYFESYCDYLITLWQPLKRCHSEPSCPTVTAFKFCKIRHKKTRQDVIQEDVPYYMYFDSDTEQMRDMTQDQETSFKFFLPKSTNKRRADRKTDLVSYSSVPYKTRHEN